MFRFLLNLLFKRADSKAPYSSQPRRWRFADGNVADELELKAQAMAKIERFWAQLRTDGNFLMGEVKQGQAGALVKWVDEYVQVIDKNIMWEAGPAANDENAFKLSLSAEARDELKPLIDTMVGKAPAIDGWILENGREALPARNIEEALPARLGAHGVMVPGVPPFVVHCTPNDEHRIDVVFESPAFRDAHDRKDLITAFMLCDLVLGERNVDRWLGVVETRPGKIEGEFKCEAASTVFASDFADAKQQLQERNPSSLWLDLSTEGDFTLSQIAGADGARITLITQHPELFTALCKSKFYSERFSNHDEKFCYLQCEGVDDFRDTDRRGELQSRIDSVLRDERIGCTVGSGAGARGFFIDLVLTDPDQAIPVLRKVCEEEKLPRGSVLRFYDADWCNEWVGMFAETPAPKSIEHWT